MSSATPKLKRSNRAGLLSGVDFGDEKEVDPAADVKELERIQKLKDIASKVQSTDIPKSRLGRNREAETQHNIQALTYNSFFSQLVEHLDIGMNVVVTKIDDASVSVCIFDPVTNPKLNKQQINDMLPDEFWSAIINERYWEFRDEWSSMSQDEKLALAEKKKAKWVHHEIPKVNSMRMFTAVLKKMRIKKWKEGYESRSKREDAKIQFIRTVNEI